MTHVKNHRLIGLSSPCYKTTASFSGAVGVRRLCSGTPQGRGCKERFADNAPPQTLPTADFPDLIREANFSDGAAFIHRLQLK